MIHSLLGAHKKESLLEKSTNSFHLNLKVVSERLGFIRLILVDFLCLKFCNCKNSNKHPENFQKLNKCSLLLIAHTPFGERLFEKKMVTFESVGWLFESYLVLVGVI